MSNIPETNTPPVVCTLGPADRAERKLEWSDLDGLALSSECIDGGMASTFPLELAEEVEDLAHRESDCCGTWLQSTIQRQGDVIRLELTTTSPDGVAMITSMAGFER